MLRFIRWHIEDLAVYVPRWVKVAYYWHRIGRVR
jgi:hypothetical protein